MARKTKVDDSKSRSTNPNHEIIDCSKFFLEKIQLENRHNSYLKTLHAADVREL